MKKVKLIQRAYGVVLEMKKGNEWLFVTCFDKATLRESSVNAETIFVEKDCETICVFDTDLVEVQW